MSIYQLYGNSTGADDVASLDVQFDGEIVGWDIDGFTADGGANGDYCEVEVSFLSSSCFSSNDCRGVIARGSYCAGLTTSGGTNTSIQKTMSGLRIPVAAGERIHLHMNCNNATLKARVVLYVLDNADPRLRRRR